MGLTEFPPRFNLYFLQWEAINLSLLASLTHLTRLLPLREERLNLSWSELPLENMFSFGFESISGAGPVNRS